MQHRIDHRSPGLAMLRTVPRHLAHPARTVPWQSQCEQHVPWRSHAKRMFDCVASVLALLVLLPVFVAIALAIFIDDRGPVLFKTPRVGRDGNLFALLKFRTMARDAEQRLAQLSHLNTGGPYMIRIPNDPRVTRTGRVLRRLALDELPQLWNVLRGEMSLVGPRPQAPQEVALYTAYERQRLRSVPGITGLWQVSARHENDFARWVALDLEYQRHWSFWLDLGIILRTPMAVTRGTSSEHGPRQPRQPRDRARPSTDSAWNAWQKWAPIQPAKEIE
ncbi:MAG TPA: sugar transferase [Ktedonobacterales bacterium]|nr:sugar transferase [Ktedonobacterales bacterium]